MVVSTALLLAPYTLMIAGVSMAGSMLPSGQLEVMMMGSVVLGALKDMATSLLKMRLLPSRWAFITYQSHAKLLTHALSALSPYVLLAASHALYPGMELRAIVWETDGLLRLCFPFVIAKFIVQLHSITDLMDEQFVLSIPSRPRRRAPAEDSSGAGGAGDGGGAAAVLL